MKRSAYEQAREKGQRVFYEPETQTIRTQPENYLIAYRADGRGWYFDIDAALLRSPKNDLNLILTETVRLAYFA